MALYKIASSDSPSLEESLRLTKYCLYSVSGSYALGVGMALQILTSLKSEGSV